MHETRIQATTDGCLESLSGRSGPESGARAGYPIRITTRERCPCPSNPRPLSVSACASCWPQWKQIGRDVVLLAIATGIV
ncbi:MAG: hypothetical protein DI524_02730 [Ectopseudomonas oleovorans]|uniref:Uncharacterized protein n=1 Tax=Ectopseudomonas oleovorans TaxID=301 RepID=A0A2W5WAJ6_ECTOL|nr:MAG: hypothetical protein DI578_07830 [Pseudomonas oleovorans]PZQ43326.1 MAG: hypothetical protein DI559_04090 [Pseudomonas oleovorans]PZR48142.1 MAG: hypothetical protein DI524_02730 [Pseudomonas oleovorans]RRW38693.1 hypothetical protein EGJ44_02575 [Pseudomonas oleovorans]